jgi:hypothetical protein
MLDAVVGEGLEAAAEPLGGVTRLLVDGLEQGVDLGKVARGRSSSRWDARHRPCSSKRVVPRAESAGDPDCGLVEY